MAISVQTRAIFWETLTTAPLSLTQAQSGFYHEDRKTTMAFVLLALMLSQPLVAKPAHSGADRNAQKNLMKNWALSICFARITQDERTKKDAGATARAYLENSQQGVEAFEQIGKLVDKYVQLEYGGSDNSDYNTMKCIDLFHSKELDRLVGTYVKNHH